VVQWKRTLYSVWAAQVISVLGFSLVIPFLPLYVRELGITDDADVVRWSGLLFSVSALVMAGAAPVWGVLADRYGRKIMVVRAMFGGAVLLTLMGFATNVYQLLALRLAQGVLTGTVSAAITLVSTTTPSERMGYSLGLMQTAVFTGAATGPFVGGFIADYFGFRASFALAGALLLAAGFLVTFGAQENFSRPVESGPEARNGLRDVVSVKGFWTVVLVVFFLYFTSMLPAPIFPLFVEELLGSKLRVASTTGVLFGVRGLVAAFAAVFIGNFSDRKGYKKVLVFSVLLSGIVYIPYALVQNVGQLFCLVILSGLMVAGITPTVNGIISSIIPRHNHGKAFGLSTSISCLGMALGPISGGWAASWCGYRLPFVVMGALYILIALGCAVRIKEPYRVTEVLVEGSMER